MARGGSRPGAGRPRGAATVRSRLLAEQALELGISPVEVLLDVMRRAHAAGDDAAAMDAASRAAPYCHPRLASVVLLPSGLGAASVATLDDAEIEDGLARGVVERRAALMAELAKLDRIERGLPAPLKDVDGA